MPSWTMMPGMLIGYFYDLEPTDLVLFDPDLGFGDFSISLSAVGKAS